MHISFLSSSSSFLLCPPPPLCTNNSCKWQTLFANIKSLIGNKHIGNSTFIYKRQQPYCQKTHWQLNKGLSSNMSKRSCNCRECIILDLLPTSSNIYKRQQLDGYIDLFFTLKCVNRKGNMRQYWLQIDRKLNKRLQNFFFIKTASKNRGKSTHLIIVKMWS